MIRSHYQDKYPFGNSSSMKARPICFSLTARRVRNAGSAHYITWTVVTRTITTDNGDDDDNKHEGGVKITVNEKSLDHDGDRLLLYLLEKAMASFAGFILSFSFHK